MNENNMNPVTAIEPTASSLKETLCLQQRLLQKLYNELDVEREAAASAASEALSMILRLQGEKAAVKMEAEQYKRLVEEKMNHAAESMEVFEEVMYQKEMEIASLDYQVQAYRYKLSSMGIDDLGVNEIKFPENLLQRSESLAAETSSDAITKKTSTSQRRIKLPNLKKGPLERDRSIVEDPETIAKIVEESSRDDESNQNLDFDKKADSSSFVDINSYMEQIRKLDKLVEGMSGGQYICPTAKTSRCSSVASKLNELDHAQTSKKTTEDKISSDACSSSVHDVFEVPRIIGALNRSEKNVKDDGRSSIFTFPQEPIKSHDEYEMYPSKKPLIPKHKDTKLFLPKDGLDVDCHLALVRPTTKPGSMSRHMNATTEITRAEDEADAEHVERNVRQEQVPTTEELELRLLYEIREKLDSIQDDIRNGNKKIKKSSPNYNIPMLQLREAMMDFWL